MGTQDLGQLTELPFSPRPIPPERVLYGVEECLRHNAYLALKNVECEFQDGVLTLRGCLPSYYLKQMAQAAVGQVAGIQQIVNEIVVSAGHRR